jgi:hypothetical protein
LAPRGKVQHRRQLGELLEVHAQEPGSKRREIPETARHEIVRIYAGMLNDGGPYGEFSKIFDLEDFGYREIRVERLMS